MKTYSGNSGRKSLHSFNNLFSSSFVHLSGGKISENSTTRSFADDFRFFFQSQEHLSSDLCRFYRIRRIFPLVLDCLKREYSWINKIKYIYLLYNQTLSRCRIDRKLFLLLFQSSIPSIINFHLSLSHISCVAIWRREWHHWVDTRAPVCLCLVSSWITASAPPTDYM